MKNIYRPITQGEETNGIKFSVAKSDETIWSENDYRITVVRPSSNNVQHFRAEKIACLCQKDTEKDFPSYSKNEPSDSRVHAFLLYYRSRGIGILVFSKKNCIKGGTWQEHEERKERTITDRPYIWTVDFIWVTEKHRDNKMATNLINSATKYLDLENENIAWSQLSEKGIFLARKFCPDYLYSAR